MTLSFALLTSDFVIALTDRRLTSVHGVETEEHDKTFGFICGDAKMAFSFSGLALAGGFNTHKWLSKTAHDVSTPDFSILGIVERLRDKLTHEFRHNGNIRFISGENKRLSVLLVGYRYTPDPVACYAIISNWQDAKTGKDAKTAEDQFSLYTGSIKPDKPCVTVGVGVLEGIDLPEIVSLRSTAIKLGRKAATKRLVNIFKNAATHNKSKNLVGGQLTSIGLDADINSGLQSDYHVSKPTRSTVMPAMVMALPDSSYVISNIKVSPVEKETQDMNVPKVGRNKLCPCGSKKKYKYCHGRLRSMTGKTNTALKSTRTETDGALE